MLGEAASGFWSRIPKSITRETQHDAWRRNAIPKGAMQAAEGGEGGATSRVSDTPHVSSSGCQPRGATAPLHSSLLQFSRQSNPLRKRDGRVRCKRSRQGRHYYPGPADSLVNWQH